MNDHPLDERADMLARWGLRLAGDMRDDVAAVHRQVANADRCDLEGLVCVLAALVPIDIPPSQLAWWRVAPAKTPPEVAARHREALCDALKPVRRAA
jgi:hypothetical protein